MASAHPRRFASRALQRPAWGLAIALALLATARPARAAGDVRFGIGPGVVHVDLPHPDRGRSFGNRPHVGFELGYRLRPWLEAGADLGFGLLGQSDSLNAVIRERRLDGLAHFTLVHGAASVRALWPLGGGRWTPFVRTAAGGVTLSLSGPEGLGSRRHDWAWSGGGGLELRAHRRLVVRAEGTDLVQWTDGGARHHGLFGLAVVVVLPGEALEVP